MHSYDVHLALPKIAFLRDIYEACHLKYLNVLLPCQGFFGLKAEGFNNKLILFTAI